MTDTALKQTQQQAEAGQIVVLFELDLTALGGSLLRFTSTARESAAILWDGNSYVPINVEANGFEWNSDGAFPTPTLRISNVEFATQSAIKSYNDLVGGKLTRIRTFRRFLDDGVDPDTTAKFPDDIYFVDKKTAHNKIFVEWELKSAMDHEDKFLPGRQILRDSCSHIYRVWTGSVFDYTKATCPYVGGSYWDAGNNVEALPENDQCGKRLSSCRLRFGTNGVLPTRAFPGVMRISG